MDRYNYLVTYIKHHLLSDPERHEDKVISRTDLIELLKDGTITVIKAEFTRGENYGSMF